MDIRRNAKKYLRMALADREQAYLEFFAEDCKLKIDFDPTNCGFDAEFEGLDTFLAIARYKEREEISRIIRELEKDLEPFRNFIMRRWAFQKELKGRTTKIYMAECNANKNRSTFVKDECGTHEIFGEVSTKSWYSQYWQNNKVLEEHWLHINRPTDIHPCCAWTRH